MQLPGQEIGCQRKNWFAPGTLAIDMQLFLAPLILDLISKKTMKLIMSFYLWVNPPGIDVLCIQRSINFKMTSFDPKKERKYFCITALVSKIGQILKIMAQYHAN